MKNTYYVCSTNPSKDISIHSYRLLPQHYLLVFPVRLMHPEFFFLTLIPHKGNKA